MDRYPAKILVALSVIAVASFSMFGPQDKTPASASYIVQGRSVDEIRSLMTEYGAEVTHELGVIRAVAADLTDEQVAALRRNSDVRRVFSNEAVQVAGKPGGSKNSGGTNSGSAGTTMDTHYPSLVNANAVHDMGITGAGIGIAVLDTGLWKHDGIRYDMAGNTRLTGLYNAMTDTEAQSPLSGDDPGGHGTHVASIAVSGLMTPEGLYNGIAPGAHLISVQAFDADGHGTYADVVRAIDWVITNRSKHKIRVLNLSFSAEARSHYWDDPINQAVMVAWQKEIFVVAAAGNQGPDPMTIGVPGNVPYVMTVGAMTDNFTPDFDADDALATFSSAGPTYEGFVKPDVVAPGGHMKGLVQGSSTLATAYPEFYASDMYFEMSGTSQAAAVVSGIAALALEAEAWRSADELKCKIISAAKPAVTRLKGKDYLTYSVFQQGAGLVDAYAAVTNQTVDCANNGLHIDNDIDGVQHFGGHANQDADGNYFLMGELDSSESGYVWSNGYLWTDGTAWTNGYLWTDGYLWTEGYLWTDGGVNSNGYIWTDGDVTMQGYLWTDGGVNTNGYLWTDGGTEMATMSSWVDQE